MESIFNYLKKEGADQRAPSFLIMNINYIVKTNDLHLVSIKIFT